MAEDSAQHSEFLGLNHSETRPYKKQGELNRAHDLGVAIHAPSQARYSGMPY